jgi:hypothetical protein
MTWNTSAVAASRRCASANERLRAAVLSSRLDDSRLAVLFNSRVCPPRFSAGGAADASLRPARVLVFVAPVRVRAPRLVPFALDCPRIICRRPDAQRWSRANLSHLCCMAHPPEHMPQCGSISPLRKERLRLGRSATNREEDDPIAGCRGDPAGPRLETEVNIGTPRGRDRKVPGAISRVTGAL